MELTTQTFQISGIEFYLRIVLDDKNTAATAEVISDNATSSLLEELVSKEEFVFTVAQDENFQIFTRYSRAVMIANILYDDLVSELYGRVNPFIIVHPSVMDSDRFVNANDFISSPDDEARVIIEVLYPYLIHDTVSMIRDIYGRDIQAVMDIPGGKRVLMKPPTEAFELDFRNPYVSVDVILVEMAEN